MIDNKIRSVEIDIDSQFIIQFSAYEIVCKGAILLQEVSDEKSVSELAFLQLFSDTQSIMLRVGVIFYRFIVLSGDLCNLCGRYEVEYLGCRGEVVIGD